MKQKNTLPILQRLAEAYAHLVLAVGGHDPDYVDAFYGPAAWKEEAEKEKLPLEGIKRRANRVLAELRTVSPARMDEMAGRRHLYLTKQLQALLARVSMLLGTTYTFDEESRSLYDAVAPTHTEEHFQDTIRALGELLPGTGQVFERYARYKERFTVPKAKLDRVFTAAITESRKRTALRIDLPPEERFTVEYVTGKSWSGYNWYQGGSTSLIQVNTDFPISIDRAVDLASHEGYPGHHVYNALIEKHLVRERNWLEFSVYALFSPQSLIAEGTANYGIEMAFPAEERVEFERTSLFPLAGLDPSEAETYYRVHRIFLKLSYAGNEPPSGSISRRRNGSRWNT